MVATVGTPTRRREWLDRRLSGLKANRTRHESMWAELEEQFPSGARINTDSDPASLKSERQASVYDATGQDALRRCVAGIMSNATSPARQWHKNTIDDQEALEDADVQRWLDEVTAIQRRALQKSNAYQVLPHIYREMVVFGTGAALALPDYDNVLHLYPLVTGSYWLGQDSKGRVNACYREIWMTVSQIMERWPTTCSQSIKDAFARGEWDGFRKVIHAIEPRSRRAMSSPLALDMPWASYYYEPGSRQDDSDLLEEGGYRHFPVLAPRWRREGDDIYGYSPASEALPFVRQLQLQTLSEGKIIAREAEPPMQAPPELKNDDVDTSPNAVNYYNQTTPHGGVRRLIDPVDPSWMRASIEDVRQQVQRLLFLDLFQMLAMAGFDTKMTAHEVSVRNQEQMQLMGPVVQNMETELLVPLLDLVYFYLLEGGALPPPPARLQGREFAPEFLGTLYQAQKAVSVGQVERWLMLVGGMAQAKADPSIWDGVDTDWILRDSAANLGVPAKAVMSKDQVQALRDARAAAQTQQAELAMAQQQASTVKDLGQTPVGTGSALDALTGYS